jgi:hypothetical protein
MLRIHSRGLAWWNTEESSIETSYILVEKVCLLHVARAVMRAIRVVVPIEVESIDGDLFSGVGCFFQHFPKL